MATATAMYHSGKNPLRKVTRDSEPVHIPLGLRTRRVHKAFLRWHAPESWPILREALVRMGRADLIGDGPEHLIPREGSPAERRALAEADTIERGTRFQTQHTGVENAARPSTAGAPPRRSEAGRKGPPGAKGGPPQGSRKR
jgi:hypothetical protein